MVMAQVGLVTSLLMNLVISCMMVLGFYQWLTLVLIPTDLNSLLLMCQRLGLMASIAYLASSFREWMWSMQL